MQQTRLLFRVMIAVVALFMTGIAFANSIGRVFSDPDVLEIKTFFNPVGCPRPCFMGIRPGITTLDKAIQLLEASPWVKNVNDGPAHGGDIPLHITWNWTPQAPAFIDDQTQAVAVLWGDVVVRIDLRIPGLTFGEVQKALGPPQQVQILTGLQNDLYNNNTLRFETRFPCPMTELRHFNAFVDVYISQNESARYANNPSLPCQ